MRLSSDEQNGRATLRFTAFLRARARVSAPRGYTTRTRDPVELATGRQLCYPPRERMMMV